MLQIIYCRKKDNSSLSICPGHSLAFSQLFRYDMYQMKNVEREQPRGVFQGLILIPKEDLSIYRRVWSSHNIFFTVQSSEGSIWPRLATQGWSPNAPYQDRTIPKGKISMAVYYDGDNQRKFNADWNRLTEKVEKYKKAGLVRKLIMLIT